MATSKLIDRANDNRYGLTLGKGKTGIIYGDDDPRVVPQGDNIPKSVLYIRVPVAEVYQKQSSSELDWKLLGESTSNNVNVVFDIIRRDGTTETEIDLRSNTKIPLVLRDGTEVDIDTEV